MIAEDVRKYWEYRGDFSKAAGELAEKSGANYAGLVKLNYLHAIECYQSGELLEKALDLARILQDSDLIKKLEESMKGGN